MSFRPEVRLVVTVNNTCRIGKENVFQIKQERFGRVFDNRVRLNESVFLTRKSTLTHEL